MRSTTITACVALVLACSIPAAQRILGTVRGTHAYSGFGTVIAVLRDLDNDGVAEFAVSAATTSGASSYIEIRSGRDQRLLSRFQNPGTSLAGLGDVTGDGVPDLLVGVRFDNRLDIYSGTSGTIFASILDAPNTWLGARVLGVDDIDRDGVEDFIATADGNSGRTSRLYSGRTRGLIRSFVLIGSPTIFDDLDRDGAREILGAESGSVHVIDLRTGAIVGSTPARGSYHGFAIARLGDVDGDGTADFAASDPQAKTVFLYSGRSRALLRAVAAPHGVAHFGSALAGIGDVNGDTVPDLAIGGSSYLPGLLPQVPGLLVFASGATGAVLMRMDGNDPNGGLGAACGAVDVDGDGIRDVIVGAPGEDHLLPDQGVVRIISGRILAQSIVVGSPCGGGPFLPLLGGTRPIAGTTALLAGEWAPPVPGFLLLSPPPPLPTNLGVPECNAWIDLALAGVLAQLPPGTGRWSLPLPVPGLPGLPGLELSFQVLYGPTLGPLGFDVTNGLRWRIGW